MGTSDKLNSFNPSYQRFQLWKYIKLFIAEFMYMATSNNRVVVEQLLFLSGLKILNSSFITVSNMVNPNEKSNYVDRAILS